jgi:hypothetical protein
VIVLARFIDVNLVKELCFMRQGFPMARHSRADSI